MKLNYRPHDEVSVRVTKLGPYHNPSETYNYYPTLPFCQPPSQKEKVQNTRKRIQQDYPIQSKVQITHFHFWKDLLIGLLEEDVTYDPSDSQMTPYNITFGDSVDWRLLCQMSLNKTTMDQFRMAIHNNYFFEMVIDDDLPMWGYIGDVVESRFLVHNVDGKNRCFLFPHIQFILGYNQDRIVSARMITGISHRQDISTNQSDDSMTDIQFSYSVEWIKEDNLKWENRMSRYSTNSEFFISRTLEFNTFALVLLVSAFLAYTFIRLLKKDFSRYMKNVDNKNDYDDNENKDFGWKLIQRGVFRSPNYPTMLCSLVGAGNHLLFTTFCLFGLTVCHAINPWMNRRGSTLLAVVMAYCLSSFLGSYTSVKLYRKLHGKSFLQCILITTFLFPLTLLLVFMCTNSVALAYKSTAAVSCTKTIPTIIAIFGFFGIPLSMLGGILGAWTHVQNLNIQGPSITQGTRTVTQQIHQRKMPFYRTKIFQYLISGFLPFPIIYIELHSLLDAMWGYQSYTSFTMLFLAFILLILVTSFITVSLLYFQLGQEDHCWWWTSFMNGGMSGVAIYIYSFIYFHQYTYMKGALQISFYFGYMGIISLAVFLMIGSVSFQFSHFFVQYIYSQVKCD